MRWVRLAELSVRPEKVSLGGNSDKLTFVDHASFWQSVPTLIETKPSNKIESRVIFPSVLQESQRERGKPIIVVTTD